MLAVALLLTAAGASAAGGVVSARSHTVTTRLSAYARVAPVAVLNVRAPLTGIVTGLKVRPGDPVRSGLALTRLRGPAVKARLAARRDAVRSARAALAAARKTLAVRKRKLTLRLSTQQAVDQARAALTEAQANLDNARSHLQAVTEMTRLRSAGNGSVLSVRVANGERVKAGQVLLTVQPAGGLWLTAEYYGTAAASVHAGMHGRFVPADGGPAVPVKVHSVVGAVESDGGETVGLTATAASPSWRNGEAGTVTLEGTSQTLAEVPTPALVLDQGRWWVLVHTAGANHRRAVVPGPTRGGWTTIRQGLQPGTAVVVQNAYLEFHREVSRHYQPPD
ncbi:MAG: efflux RND transporter periplasmic adaptor subunit [Gammaproteobacteria bacterium]